MKLLIASVFLAGVWHTSLRAETPTLMSVATCTGRLSALLEYQWAVRDPRADKTEQVRDHMTDLLFAIMTPETDRLGRAYRTEAKQSFRSLLDRLPLDDPASKAGRMASHMARQDIALCAALILPRDEIEPRLGWSDAARLVQVAPDMQRPKTARFPQVIGK
jgi:hypothetical protein